MKRIQAEVAVIGGGMAGLPIANKAAYKGRTTVLFEKELLGGTCLNRGCIPTKTMLHAAKVAHVVRTARRFGIEAGQPGVDLVAIVRRKDEIVESIRQGAYRLLGAQIIGPHAGELIHELILALDLGASYERIGRSVHVHPTLAEGINSAAGGVHRPAGDT